MTDDVKISSPVKIESTSKEQVALKLMEKISSSTTIDKTEKKDRKYWFTLYRQCLKATSGHNL